MKKILGVCGIVACIVLLVLLARGYSLVFWIGIVVVFILSYILKKFKF